MVVMVVIISDVIFIRNVIFNLEIMYFLVNFNYFIYIFMVDYYRYWNGFL